jgi:hypothetical protein
MKRLFIFEFKHSKDEDNLERDAECGMNQILEKEYYNVEQYQQWTCIAIGVLCTHKKMSPLKFHQFKI